MNVSDWNEQMGVRFNCVERKNEKRWGSKEETPGEIIGKLIFKQRKENKLCQDAYGMQFDINGVTVSKYENGDIVPRLELWLRVADDMQLDRQQAIMIWLHDKLPKKYRGHISTLLHDDSKSSSDSNLERQNGESPEDLITDVPENLRLVLDNDKFVAQFRPASEEILFVMKNFGEYRSASPRAFIDALRVARVFLNSRGLQIAIAEDYGSH